MRRELVGDVNNDGKISSIDAQIILLHSANNVILDTNALLRAEVNGDDAITSMDARRILKHIQGVDLITDAIIITN